MEMQAKHTGTEMKDMKMNKSQYPKLLLMVVLSFISMYMLMYAMVNVWGNVVTSLNQFYMAGLMTAPMIVIEMLLMGSMYKNKKINLAIIVASILLGILFFILIRQQVAISDTQFLRSMIPHHGGAILMCQQASLSDAEVKDLCRSIITNQQAEIDLMKSILERLAR